MFHSVHCLQQIACRFYGGGTIFLVGMLLGTHCHYFPLDYLSFCLTGSKFDEMDPPGLTSPQSLKLTMVSSFDDHFPSHSQCNSVRGGIIYGVGAQSSRDLLYDQLHNMIAQEKRDGYKCCDYLSFYSLQPEKRKTPKNIDASCRTSICGWMYRVADHFTVDREGELSFCATQ